jgi:hypothetical protein
MVFPGGLRSEMLPRLNLLECYTKRVLFWALATDVTQLVPDLIPPSIRVTNHC